MTQSIQIAAARPLTLDDGRLPSYDHDYRVRDIAAAQVPTADLAPGDALVVTIDSLPHLAAVVWTSQIVGAPATVRRARLITWHPEGVDQAETTLDLPAATWTVIRAAWGRNLMAGPAAVQDHARLAPGRTACNLPLAISQDYVGQTVDWDRVLAPVDAPREDRWCLPCLLSLALTAGHATEVPFEVFSQFQRVIVPDGAGATRTALYLHQRGTVAIVEDPDTGEEQQVPLDQVRKRPGRHMVRTRRHERHLSGAADPRRSREGWEAECLSSGCGWKISPTSARAAAVLKHIHEEP
ncbi:hypothetical protein [Nocardiopsis synnemataformans]|uniref:hypothetical protein n=1 Tax=Nocardiopsis synnemataformans TaxID=61305 RepID=UPI003EBF8728